MSHPRIHHPPAPLWAVLAALALVLSGIAIPATPAAATEFSVTSLADSGPGTLRQAILGANAHPGHDTITVAVSGTAVVRQPLVLTGGTSIVGPGRSKLKLRAAASLNGPILAATSTELSDVELSGLTLQGDGPLSVAFAGSASGGGDFRRFVIRDAAVLDFPAGGAISAHASIQLGVYDTVFARNGGVGSVAGGALRATGPGSLLIAGSSFESNTAPSNLGGAIAAIGAFDVVIGTSRFTANSADYGGALAVQGGSGITSIGTSVFERNSAYAGGAIRMNSRSGQLHLADDRLVANTSLLGGSALAVEDMPKVTLYRSTVAGNTATAIDTTAVPSLTLSRSTFDGNDPKGTGSPAVRAVGLDTISGEPALHVLNSTFVEANAIELVGAAPGSQNLIRHSTFSAKRALAADASSRGELMLSHVVVAGSASEPAVRPGGGTAKIEWSLLPTSANPGAVYGDGVIRSDAPKLGPLADNGGPTRTMLPQPGSAAIDSGLPGIWPWTDTDQRGEGFPRKVGEIDLGAVETGTVLAATPTIRGTGKVGRTLRASAGAWKPAGVKPSYRWLRNGAAIGGATGASYRLKAVDRGKRISVRVTGSLAGHPSTSRTSAQTAVVSKGTLSTRKPTVRGTAQVGALLRAKTRSWHPRAVKLSYRWLRNGAAIRGATGRSYRVTEADLGKKISVRVTGKLTGYRTAIRVSSAKRVR